MTDSQIQSSIACTAGNTPTIRHDGTFLIKGGDLGMPARCKGIAEALGLDLTLEYGCPVFSRRGDKGSR